MRTSPWRRWLGRLSAVPRPIRKRSAKKRQATPLTLQVLEDRSVSAVIISEVDPSGSGRSYAADWFEVTNTGTSDVNLTGWKMDDNSNGSPASAEVALHG